MDTLVGPHPLSYDASTAFDDVVACLWTVPINQLVNYAIERCGPRRQLSKKSYLANRRLEIVSHAFSLSPLSVARIVRERGLIDPEILASMAHGAIGYIFATLFGRRVDPAVCGIGDDYQRSNPFERLGPDRLRSLNYADSATENVGRDERRIFADDLGSGSDLMEALEKQASHCFGARGANLWRELLGLVGANPDGARAWVSTSYFAQHVSTFSKSRRKAPVYWQLATRSAGYSVWLYYHEITKDTFYAVLSDHVEPKLQHEERRLSALLTEAGPSPNAAQRRRIAEQETFVEELRAFREDIARIAPLWDPSHDDGVIINFAPLWRLVPQHRAWQRECKACWNKLVAGDYDWSYLAMHRAGRAEMHPRPKPRHRPRARGGVLV
jgi:hypothetical protein